MLITGGGNGPETRSLPAAGAKATTQGRRERFARGAGAPLCSPGAAPRPSEATGTYARCIAEARRPAVTHPMSSRAGAISDPAPASARFDRRTRVIVASTVLLSFISYWRAAAVVLSDLGSTEIG